MPKVYEDMLRRRAEHMGLKGDRKNAYIFGTLREKFHWKPNREK